MAWDYETLPSQYARAVNKKLDYQTSFSPTLDANSTLRMMKHWQDNPNRYTSKESKRIEDHMEWYGIDKNMRAPEDRNILAKTVGEFGKGFFHGITTWNPGFAEGTSDMEQISRSIGHLAGFAGFVPGVGKVFRKIGAHKLAQAAEMGRLSVPMAIAKKTTDYGSKVANSVLKKGIEQRAGVSRTVSDFLLEDKPKHILEGAFNLGIASAVSSWQYGVDEMLSQAKHGFIAGGVFRGLGEIGAKRPVTLVRDETGKRIVTLEQKQDMAIRALAGSLFTGLPSTFRGDTTPQQVYQYLLGGMFGAMETSAVARGRNEFLKKMNTHNIKKRGEKKPEELNFDPELTPGWGELSPAVKKAVKEEAGRIWGTAAESGFIHTQILSKTDRMPDEGFKDTGKVNKFGETLLTPEKAEDYKAGQISWGKPSKDIDSKKPIPERSENIDISKETTKMSDNDLNEVATPEITLKAVNFATYSLPSVHKGSMPKITEAAVKVDALLTKFQNRKTPKINRSEDLVKAIEAEFKTTLNKEQAGHLRQWINTRNNGMNPKQFSIVAKLTGDEKGRIIDSSSQMAELEINNPINLAKNRKHNPVPEMPIEIAMKNADLRNGVVRDRGDRAYATIDHVVIREGGRYKEVPLTAYRDMIGNRAYNKQLTEWYKGLEKKGYHYFSGRGDADRMIFVKNHPDIENLSSAKIKTTVDKAVKSMPKEEGFSNTEALRKAREEFAKDMIGMKKAEADKLFNKIYLSNVMWDAEMNGTIGRNDIFGSQFIGNAVAYNKRAQIWFTNGYEANTEFYKNKIKTDYWKPEEKTSLKAGRIRFILYEDAPGKKLNNKSKASEYTEATDGAIPIRKDWLDIMNEDFGMPSSGQNKSFIVSPNAKRGALLGKYMFHTDLAPADAFMKSKGVAMMIPRSAAKQFGNREIYKMDDIVSGKVEPKVYEMEINHIRGIYSEKQTFHMIQPQRVPKQLLTNLTPWAKENINPKVIEDMFQSIVKTGWDGDPTYTAKLRKLANTKGKWNNEVIEDIAVNIERVNMNELLQVMKMPGKEPAKLAQRVYSEILKVNAKNASEMAASRDIDPEMAENFISEQSDYSSPTERMLKLGDHIGSYMHKYVRDYRMTAMKNYIANQVFRPKLPNSLSARMRPYSYWMRKDRRFKELETKDDIFYLDDAYRNVQLELPEGLIAGKTRMKLGELWDSYGHKPNVKEFLTSVSLRVPMDSISGAHVLKFRGFTGIEGHGILMHPRSMRALGGADLDGDKAFVFFGFKKSWRDAYGKNKMEFLDKEGKISDNKTAPLPEWVRKMYNMPKGSTYRHLLTKTHEGTKKERALKKSQVWMYSPKHRLNISQEAAAGRNQLGPSVVSKQILTSAYAEVKNSPKGYVETWFGKVKPRKNLNYSRELMRSEIAFPSDPLDELGLRSRDHFFEKAFESFFEVEVAKKHKAAWNAGKINKVKAYRGMEIYKTLHDINSAYYGRNWGQGRAHTFDEVMALSDGLNNLPGRSTMLPKMAELVREVDYSDSPFNRISASEVDLLYKTFKKRMETGDYNRLRSLLGRGTFAVPFNPNVGGAKMINTVYTRRLMDWANREALATYKDAEFREIFKGSKWDSAEFWEKANEGGPKGEAFRRYAVEQYVRTAEDFMINDLYDMTSADIISRLASEIPNTDFGRDFIQTSSKFAQHVKDIDHMNFLQRNPNLVKKIKKMQVKDKKVKIEDELTVGEMKAAHQDRSNLDLRIREFKFNIGKGNKWKRPLTVQEAEFFDMLLLSSLNRGPYEQLQRVMKSKKKIRPHEQASYNELLKAVNATNMSRTALGSSAVSDKNVSKFLKEYGKLFREETYPSTEKETAKIQKEVDSYKPKDVEEIKNVDPFEDPYAWVDRVKAKAGTKTTPEMQKVADQLVDNINYYNNSIGEDLNLIARKWLNKDLEAFTLEDFRTMNRHFNDLRSGTWFARMFESFTGNKLSKELSQRHWWMFPRAVNRDLMRHEFKLAHEQGFFTNYKGEVKQGTLAKPTFYIERSQFWNGKATDLALKMEEVQRGVHNEALKKTGMLNTERGRDLYEAAAVIREQGMPQKMRWDPNDPLSMMHKQAYEQVNKEVLERINWKELKDTEIEVQTGTKVEKLTGSQMVERINEALTERNIETMQWIKGDEFFYDRANKTWVKQDITKTTIYKFIQKKKGEPQFYDVAQTQPKIDVNKFVRYINEQFKVGNAIPIEKFGMDGIRKISRSVMLQSGMASKKFKEVLLKNKIMPTGDYPAENYYPHFFDQAGRRRAGEYIKKTIKIINERADWPTNRSDAPKGYQGKVKAEEIQKMLYKYKSIQGEWLTGDIEDFHHFSGALRDIAAKKSNSEHVRWFEQNPSTGNMRSRTSHIPGWRTDPQSYEVYQKNLIDTFHRQIAQILTRKSMEDFYFEFRNKWGKKLTGAWYNYMDLYAQDAMGYPSVIPDYMVNDPNMKLSGTPYKWFADNRVANRLSTIKEKLGISKDTKLPEELRRIDVNDIRHWSNLEAKFSMASLLAHPKSAVANLYGGTLHTMISAGWGNFKNSRNIKFIDLNLPRRIGKDGKEKPWSSMEEVNDWVTKHGVIPEMFLHEIGANPVYGKGRYKDAFNEIVDMIKKDPKVKDSKIRDLATKHGISDSIMDKLSWFMRAPERTLRRDAFVAHYLAARQRFGNADMPLDHPMLIQMAKKGVQATQFLYSAPYRPAFARTALGKVWTRFQLWAWNSVRFRKDIINQAHLHGFMEGTPEFEAFKRMAITDMFVLGMANVFAYSIFESALPAPYSWMQDTSEWLFGDERERDRAFFGAWPSQVAPLQMVTPPILRLGPPSFRAMLSDDWGKISDYYIWTMFPAGRMLRDVKKTIENPSRGIEHATGIPYLQVGREAKKYRDEEIPFGFKSPWE